MTAWAIPARSPRNETLCSTLRCPKTSGTAPRSLRTGRSKRPDGLPRSTRRKTRRYAAHAATTKPAKERPYTAIHAGTPKIVSGGTMAAEG